MKRGKTTIGIIAIIATLAIAAVAFAHGGYGRHMGGYGGGHGGYGYGHMMDGDRGYGPHMRGYGKWQGLSDEEAAKIEEERDRFFNETRDIRKAIDDTRSAMRREMIKDNPDQEKVSKLQAELSELNAAFDQKQLAHRLVMRKLLPEDFKGRKLGRYDGRGRGYCR